MTTTVKHDGTADQLEGLLARAEGGEDLIITRNDEPVARLIPIERMNDGSLHALMNEILVSRQGRPTTSIAEILSWRHADHAD